VESARRILESVVTKGELAVNTELAELHDKVSAYIPCDDETPANWELLKVVKALIEEVDRLRTEMNHLQERQP
jgi:hypothetical protein